MEVQRGPDTCPESTSSHEGMHNSKWRLSDYKAQTLATTPLGPPVRCVLTGLVGDDSLFSMLSILHSCTVDHQAGLSPMKHFLISSPNWKIDSLINGAHWINSTPQTFICCLLDARDGPSPDWEALTALLENLGLHVCRQDLGEKAQGPQIE